jgi:hemerythrin-like domain-containing protein
MFSKNPLCRRSFIALAGATGAAALAGCSKPDQPPGEAATAIEILARQHGVICRAVAILEEIKGGMDAWMDLPPETIGGTVEIVRLFVIEHHQHMEEKHIFPVFEAAGKMSNLVGVLRKQHAAGSQLIGILRELYREFSAEDLEKRRTMACAIHLFSRMCRAHTAREDTALFPLLRRMMTQKAYAELSSGVKRAESEFLGRDGFDETIRKLADYENILGIGDLAGFTPNPEELS